MAVKLPEPFGFGLVAETRNFHALNLGFFVLPFLTAYLAWKRGLGAAGLARLLVNLYPFRPGGYTLTLAAIHLPIALWLTVGLAYVGFRWRDPDARNSDFGFTPNRTAALGENLILLVNLAWSARLYARFLRGRAPFSALERWQTSYLPVYAAWALVVAAVFPLVFVFE